MTVAWFNNEADKLALARYLVAPVRGHHRWPAYVTADIEFEVES